MKLNVISFSLSTLIVGTIPLAILFIWCALNGFGLEFVRIFESIHPSGGLSIIENMSKGFSARIFGIFINIFYVAADTFIAGFALSSIYNFLNKKIK